MPEAGVHLDGGPQERLDVPMSIAVHALRRAGPSVGEKALVLGAGPVGLAAVLAATAVGLEVMVADPEVHRRQLARNIGAARVAWGDPAQLNDVTRDKASGADEALTPVAEVVSAARCRFRLRSAEEGLKRDENVFRRRAYLTAAWR